MAYIPLTLTRREFAAATAAALATAAAPPALHAAIPPAANNRYCAFIKYLTRLNYEELADGIAAIGFGGVEVTVRSKDGYIRPERAADDLPKFKEVLDKRGLKIAIITTDILQAEQPHAESVLLTASNLGIPRYRMGFYRYDLTKPIVPQIEYMRPHFENLAALNRQLGIAGGFQNHSGADRFGATIWDLHSLIKDLPPEQIGCVYDLRHATVEAGEAWPMLYEVMKPHITAMSVKDFVWKGRISDNVPLGQGMVDPAFYERLAKSDYAGPISLHVEYLKADDPAGNLAALKRDFATLRTWMGE